MKRSLLIIFYCATIFGQKLDDQWNTRALQRLMHEWDVKLEKMELHLQNSMRRAGVDMWIIMSREFNVDPILQMFGITEFLVGMVTGMHIYFLIQAKTNHLKEL